jgi:hypothetical protein
MTESKRGETFVLKGEPVARQVDFTTFLFGLASTTLIHLGAAPHPETGQTQVDLALARESLDLLSMLREKTKGNLTAEEEQVFAKLLADLRLQWVERAKR